jgi:hypothetical protein
MSTAPTGASPSAPALPRREPYSTLLGSLIIAAIALFYSHGLPFIADRIPGTSGIAAGTRIDLGRGVSYATAAGWSVDLAKTKPKDTSALVHHASSFAITSAEWTASQSELIERVKKLFEGMQHLHVYGAETPFRTPSGLDGTTFNIQGENLEGRVWVIVLPDGKRAIAARLRGQPGHLNDDLRAAQAMVDSLKVEAAP